VVLNLAPDPALSREHTEKRRREQSFGEEGLEDFSVPPDLPIEAIAREVQESWQLKVLSCFKHACNRPAWPAKDRELTAHRPNECHSALTSTQVLLLPGIYWHLRC